MSGVGCITFQGKSLTCSQLRHDLVNFVSKLPPWLRKKSRPERACGQNDLCILEDVAFAALKQVTISSRRAFFMLVVIWNWRGNDRCNMKSNIPGKGALLLVNLFLFSLIFQTHLLSFLCKTKTHVTTVRAWGPCYLLQHPCLLQVRCDSERKRLGWMCRSCVMYYY